MDESAEAAKSVIKALDGEDSPLLQVLDIIINQQQKAYPGKPVFKSISMKGTSKVNLNGN